MSAEPVVLGPYGLSREEVVAVARKRARVSLSSEARARIVESRARRDAQVRGDKAIYGVTTGFGALANTRIPASDLTDLQYALIRSTAAGMGPPLPREVVRAMMVLRARTLALGYSGIHPELVESFLDLLNADITPYVPCYGSLGASGDLAPLAHIAEVLVGEGQVLSEDGSARDSAPALRRAGIPPVQLEPKEGLALINGTDGMLGMLVLGHADAMRLFRTADVACAMSIEALLGTDRVFQPELHVLRPHPGQLQSARNVAALLRESPIVASHRVSEHAVQDAYSLRCHPQVVGAARDTLEFVEHVADRELVSLTDNPIVLLDGRIESAGNFHGEPLAFACDYLAIAAAEVGAIAERRVDRMLDKTRSNGLPAFLSPEPGLNCGLMIPQYTAAALVAEKPATGCAGKRGFHSDVGDARGPRVDGLGSRAEAAIGARQSRAHSRDRDVMCDTWARAAGTTRAGAGEPPGGGTSPLSGSRSRPRPIPGTRVRARRAARRRRPSPRRSGTSRRQP